MELTTKQQLQSEIEDLVFLNSADDLTSFHCRNCQKIAIFYIVGPCIHRPVYCRNCFDHLYTKDCQDCHQIISEEINQNNAYLDTQLSELKVACPFKINGCSEELSLTSFLEHKANCHCKDVLLTNHNDEDIAPVAGNGPQDAEMSNSTCDMKESTNSSTMEIVMKRLQERVKKAENDLRLVRLNESRINELDILVKKLNKEIGDRQDAERKIMDYLKKKNETQRQLLKKYISDEVTQQFNKRVNEFEKKQSVAMNATLEKFKEDFQRTSAIQINQVVERQVTELRRKTEVQNQRKSDHRLDVMDKKLNQMKIDQEKQHQSTDNKITVTISRNVNSYKKALMRDLNLQIIREIDKRYAHLQSKYGQLPSDKSENDSQHSLSNVHNDTNLDDEDNKTLDELNQEAMEIVVKELIEKQLNDKVEKDKQFIMDCISDTIKQKLEDSEQLSQRLEDLKLEMDKGMVVQLDQQREAVQKMKENIEQQITDAFDKMDADVNLRISEGLLLQEEQMVERLTSFQQEFKNELDKLQDDYNKKLEIELQRYFQNGSLDFMKAFDHKSKTPSESEYQVLVSTDNVDQIDAANVEAAFLQVETPKNSVESEEREIKQLIINFIGEVRDKTTKEILKKMEFQKEDVLQQVDDRIVQAIEKYEDTLHNKIFTKLIEEISARKEALVRNIVETLKQDTIIQIQTLQDDITRQWNEMSTIQKEEMTDRINSQVSEQVERTVSRLERSLSLQQDYVDFSVDSGNKYQNSIVKDFLPPNQNSEDITEDDSDEHAFQTTNSRSPQLIAIISEINEHVVNIQQQLTTQIIDKVKQEEDEILNRLRQNMNEHFESLQASYDERLGASNTCQENSGIDEDQLQTKINELFLKFSEQIRSDLEKHIEDAKTPIQQVIEAELEKIKKFYEGKKGVSSSKDVVKKMIKRFREKNKRSIKRLKCYVDEGDSTHHFWRIPSFRRGLNKLLSNEVERLECTFFQVTGTPLKAKLLLSLYNKEWISLKVMFAWQRVKGKNKNFIYSHKRIFTLFDQSKGRIKRNVTAIQESDFRNENAIKWMQEIHGKDCFIRAEELLKEDSVYINNEAVLFRVVLQPSSAIYKSISNDSGILFWKINNYVASKQAEKDGLIESLYSDYFYSHLHGYRLQVRAYLTGHGDQNSDYMSLFLHIQSGPWDEFLPRQFPYKVTFTLLNQSTSPDKQHITKSIEFTKDTIVSSFGIEEFALQTEVEKECYLNDDIILLNVTVEPLDG